MGRWCGNGSCEKKNIFASAPPSPVPLPVLSETVVSWVFCWEMFSHSDLSDPTQKGVWMYRTRAYIRKMDKAVRLHGSFPRLGACTGIPKLSYAFFRIKKVWCFFSNLPMMTFVACPLAVIGPDLLVSPRYWKLLWHPSELSQSSQGLCNLPRIIAVLGWSPEAFFSRFGFRSNQSSQLFCWANKNDLQEL